MRLEGMGYERFVEMCMCVLVLAVYTALVWIM